MRTTVRRFRLEDAPALAALFHAAVHQLGQGDYSPGQLDAWSPAVGSPAHWASRAGDGRVTFVATDECDRPIAYVDLERDGHIDHLYRHPDHPGSAGPLHAALESEARAQGIASLHVEASEQARRFLARRGFEAIGRRDFAIDGVAIHNWAMVKPLTVA